MIMRRMVLFRECVCLMNNGLNDCSMIAECYGFVEGEKETYK